MGKPWDSFILQPGLTYEQIVRLKKSWVAVEIKHRLRLQEEEDRKNIDILKFMRGE